MALFVEVDDILLAEDETADRRLRRGRTVGGGWIVASGGALGFATGASEVSEGAAWLGVSSALLATALVSRLWFWDRAARELGDAAMQRARWRSARAFDRSPERRIACMVVLVFLATATLP